MTNDRGLDLAGPEWDIPVTERFVQQVRDGLRRRRRRRRWLAAGSAGLATATLVTAVALAASPPPPSAPPIAGTSPSVRAEQVFEGFVFSYLPPGISWAPPDGQDSAQVGPAGLDRSLPQPRAGDAGVTIRMRRFVHPNGGNALFLTVYRPLPPASGTSAPPIGEWVLGGLLADSGEQVSTFQVPAGIATVTEHRGSEVTTYSLFVAAADGVVISVEGDASLTRDRVESLAYGIRPA